jgi:transcriptional regulator with XRE-family HTH domain
MITKEELMKTEEFWFETIQNDLYRKVSEYIKKEDINQTQFAEKLGVSKGYISQILNGNFNATLKKLIELSLAVDKAPVFDFKDLDEYIKEASVKKELIHSEDSKLRAELSAR